MKEERILAICQDELIYTCGATLFPEGIYKEIIVTREGMSCASPIETTYYAGVFLL